MVPFDRKLQNNPHGAQFWRGGLQWVQSTYIQFGMRPFISDVSRMQKECTNRIYFMSYEKIFRKTLFFLW